MAHKSKLRESSDDALIDRVNRRVLTQVAEMDMDRHATVHADVGAFQPFLEGVEIRVLHVAEEPGHTVISYLLRMSPGAVIPAHRHPMDEECIVLEGLVRIGSRLALGRGDFHLARAGTIHPDIQSDGGALIYLRGAEPQQDQLV